MAEINLSGTCPVSCNQIWPAPVVGTLIRPTRISCKPIFSPKDSSPLAPDDRSRYVDALCATLNASTDKVGKTSLEKFPLVRSLTNNGTRRIIPSLSSVLLILPSPAVLALNISSAFTAPVYVCRKSLGSFPCFA